MADEMKEVSQVINTCEEAIKSLDRCYKEIVMSNVEYVGIDNARKCSVQT